MEDTTRDIRIQYIEFLINRVRDEVQRRLYGSHRQVGSAQKLLEEMSSQVTIMRYSYLDDEQLAASPITLFLSETGPNVVATLLENQSLSPMQVTFLKFFASLLGQLPQGLVRGHSLEALTPVQVGEVLSADKAPKTKGLLLCRVAAFDATLQIITNMLDTRAGQHMKVARIPPSEIMGLVRMLCSSVKQNRMPS